MLSFCVTFVFILSLSDSSITFFFFLESGFKIELMSALCEVRCVRVCASVFYTAFFKFSFERFVF